MSLCTRQTKAGRPCRNKSKTGDCGLHTTDRVLVAHGSTTVHGSASHDPFAADDPWAAAGLDAEWDDEDHPRPLNPQQAARWRDAGFTAAQTHSWRRVGAETPGRATAMALRATEAGYDDTIEWQPENVTFFGHQIRPAAQAGAWASAGFTPAQANGWMDRGFRYADGRGPVTAREWHRSGWGAEPAAAWLDTNPRLTPRDATCMTRYGVHPGIYVEGDEQFAVSEYRMTVEREMDGGLWDRRDDWRESGIDGGKAAYYFEHGVGPGEAARWELAGVFHPLDWREAALSPSQAGQWRAAGFEAFQARDLRDLGWTPETATAHMRRLGPDEAEEFRIRPHRPGEQ